MEFTDDVYDLRAMSDDEITSFLETHRIGLTNDEARQLQFSILGRPPSLAEYILFGIEGSEHCSYKSSRVHLSQFTTEGPDVVLGAKEDAGIVRAARDHDGHGYCIVMSHESHNHPSQIVPYEGAATGVGGNVRDVCCMGAEVIAVADDLRFGSLDNPKTKWLYEGVVSGIAGYGNPIGVPSLAGGLQFDPGYRDNCLVTVVSLGIVREDCIIHSYVPQESAGYDLILVGKPTDSSGFGGASFASFELSEDAREQNKGAVQEPNAFLGRHLIQASTALFAKLQQMGELHRIGCKDLGAGGIACGSVEIVESGGCGACIDLDQVHTSMEGLPPHVTLCAETQERYIWASPPDLTEVILDHFNHTYALPAVSRGAQARVIGKVTDEPIYRVASQGKLIVDAPAGEVTRGFLYHRDFDLPDPQSVPYTPPANEAIAQRILELLDHENIASRAPLYERYDKQVQGRTVVDAGDSDCGIMTPFNGDEFPPEIRQVAITLTTDQNPRINRRDPYAGAMHAVIESYTNTVASGARPAALSDCLCYGNPEVSSQMGQFVAGCRGVARASDALGIPIIAGNVSLYNESASQAIPPSPMISCLGILDDAQDRLEAAFCAPGNEIFLLMERQGLLGGSVYAELADVPLAPIAELDFDALRACGEVVMQGARAGCISSCHDISEGGIAVALCELSFKRNIGWTVAVPSAMAHAAYLFDESPGFIVEIQADRHEAFIDICSAHGVSPRMLGTTSASHQLIIEGIAKIDLETAKHTWKTGLLRRLV